MRALRTIRLRLRSLFQRHRVDEELDAELRDHLERQIEFHRVAGLSPRDARSAALREFGNITLIQEECRDMRRVNWLEDLRRDAGHAVRSMRRTPGYAAAAILSLAFVIGANVAIFNLLDAVVLRSLPVAAPGQLVLIDGMRDNGTSIISYPMYRDLAERQQVFTDLMASRDYLAEPLRVRTSPTGIVQVVRGGAVTANYFSTLGLVPARGRFFVRSDDGPGGAASVAVISHGFWQRELGGADSVIGQTLSINDEVFTIVGVAPAGFTGLSIDSSLDIWVPLTKFRSARDLTNRRGTFFRLVGRLKPGVTIAQAEASMTLLFQQLVADELQSGASETADARGYRVALQPGDRGFAFFRERFGRTVRILMAMAVLLVAIVGMNLATLLSARATVRRREIAVRHALGASRRRLLQQVLTENLLIALLGGAGGLLLAVWASRILLSLVSTEIALHAGFNPYVPQGLQFQLDLRLLALTAGVAVLVGLFLALAPAPLLKRLDVMSLLKQRSGSSDSLTFRYARIPVRRVLVVMQVTLSVVLLVGAGLMTRTMINLRGLDAGFDPANVLLVDIDVTDARRTGSGLTELEHDLHERLNAVPGVRSASLSWISLFSDADRRTRVSVNGETPPDAAEKVAARFDAVSANYFETLGMTVVAGRTFTTRDNASAPRVAVVNQAFVRRFLPDTDPIGKQFSADTLVQVIVGVVRDAKYNDLRENTREMFYVPLLQTPMLPARSIALRIVGPPQKVIPLIRRAVTEADPNIVITENKSLADQVSRTMVRERLLADLSTFFGAAALLLACLGLYSVLAYHVIQRTQEIGVRIALGSSTGEVMWLVARDALKLVGLGVILGIPAALALSRVVASQLFGVSPTDPATIAIIIMILFGVAGVSSYLPARRAARVDPIVALASE